MSTTSAVGCTISAPHSATHGSVSVILGSGISGISDIPNKSDIAILVILGYIPNISVSVISNFLYLRYHGTEFSDIGDHTACGLGI